MTTPRVKFSNSIKIINIPSKKNMPNYHQFIYNLMTIIDRTNIRIMQVINSKSPHKIVIANKEDIPIKFHSPYKNWYEDDTPIIIHEKLMYDSHYLDKFIQEYNHQVQNNVPQNMSSSLNYNSKLGNFKVKILAVTRK